MVQYNLFAKTEFTEISDKLSVKKMVGLLLEVVVITLKLLSWKLVLPDGQKRYLRWLTIDLLITVNKSICTESSALGSY